jgi:magnesium transporter
MASVGMASVTSAKLNDPVTGYLRHDFTRLYVDQTVGQALDWLRAHPPQGRILYFYVVDREDRLCGIVPSRRLILDKPQTPLAHLMMARVISLPADATVLEACEFFIQHRLLAFPVLDMERRILGLVDVEVYTEELQDLSDAKKREDVFQLLGVHLAQGRRASPLSAFRDRFPWLGCNLAAGILAAVLSSVYATELNRLVALAFFIPVVLNLAESVSSQSVSLALHALQGRLPTWRSLLAELRAELATGFLLGAGSGLIVALTSLAWLGHVRLAFCLFGAIMGGVAGAAVMGLALPVILRLMHLEPKVAAGPIALASADVVTILVYFNLARWLVG